MIKRLLTLALVFAIASCSMAATVSLVVDPDDIKPSDPIYTHSDTFTILLVGEGFTAPPDGFCSLTINGGIMGPGTASAPAVNTTYLPQLPQNGTCVNDGVTLIAGPITGTAAMGDLTGVPNWDGMGSSQSDKYAYSFEYHVPDLPSGTKVTLYATDIVVGGSFGAPVSVDFVPLNFYIDIPEPMTIALLSLGGLFLRRRR